MKIHDTLIQGTDEWLEVRRGKITASVVNELLTSTFKISKGEKIRLLAFELASQRITGRIEDRYESFDMKRGHIEEGIARDLYAAHYAPVKEVGFIEDGILGFSPDGLVGDDGIIEIKSRKAKFQVKTFFEDSIPTEYVCQIQTGLIVSGRQWCDFVQYSNGMPLFVKRAYRDETIIHTILQATAEFEKLIQEIVSTFETNRADAPVAAYVEDLFLSEGFRKFVKNLDEPDISNEDAYAEFLLSQVD